MDQQQVESFFALSTALRANPDNAIYQNLAAQRFENAEHPMLTARYGELVQSQSLADTS